MKNPIKKITGLVFVAIFIISCATYKKEMYHGEGTLEQARMNAIIDFAATYKTPRSLLKKRDGKPFNVFWAVEYEKAKDTMPETYIFSLYPDRQGHISLSTKDIVGKTTDWFPTRYKEMNGKLFLWKDSLVPLSREIIEVIHSYGILDSTDVKKDLGLLPDNFEDTRLAISSQEYSGSAAFYFCKNDVSKYKKVKTNIAIGYYTPPKLDCE